MVLLYWIIERVYQRDFFLKEWSGLREGDMGTDELWS